LIAAPSDQSTGHFWWAYTNTQVFASGTAIGTGNANTVTIITAYGFESYAAYLCYDLTLGGYSDWYLPSQDELNVLYQNREAIGGFTGNSYWSSTELGQGYAYRQDFSAGTQGYSLKTSMLYVRAIRTF